MITPQQIEQIAFNRVTFGGYDMQAVDEFLEPLTEDYITLYKENALLKSKMKVLVGKLEEYRNNEASMKDAIVNAQKTCDLMVKEAEAKCTQMLSEANATAAENLRNSDALIAAEEARVEEAKKVATTKIDELQSQLRSCMNALERIKANNQPSQATTDSLTRLPQICRHWWAPQRRLLPRLSPAIPSATPRPASSPTCSLAVTTRNKNKL